MRKWGYNTQNNRSGHYIIKGKKSRKSCDEEEAECDDEVEYDTPNLLLYIVRRVLSAQVIEDMKKRENL